MGTETLDELPVRHPSRLEPLARDGVIVARRLDEQRAPLARADAAAERLLGRRGGITFPKERLDDDRPAARRARRSVQLAHRDPVWCAHEHALADSIERREDLIRGGRLCDHTPRPFPEPLTRSGRPPTSRRPSTSGAVHRTEYGVSYATSAVWSRR